MKWSDKFKKQMFVTKNGFWIDIQSESLRRDVEFVLYSLPKKLISGIEFSEEVFDKDPSPSQVIVKSTMSIIDIKRQVGAFIFRKRRWKEGEDITQKLLTQEKIDLEDFYKAYDTDDYLTAYEMLNADVFAVYYDNPSMNLDEISIAVNALYVRAFIEKSHSTELESFIDDLFKQE